MAKVLQTKKRIVTSFHNLSIELQEELNMQVAVGSLYAKHTFEYPDFIITLSLYECEMQSEFTLNEHESYAWIAPKDLNEEEWAPADADILGTLKRVFGE